MKRGGRRRRRRRQIDRFRGNLRGRPQCQDRMHTRTFYAHTHTPVARYDDKTVESRFAYAARVSCSKYLMSPLILADTASRRQWTVVARDFPKRAAPTPSVSVQMTSHSRVSPSWKTLKCYRMKTPRKHDY